MRTIKKTVKVTTAHVYKIVDPAKAPELVEVATYEGGKGERLIKSEMTRKHGDGLFIQVENSKVCYKMSAELFFKYAEVCEDETEANEDEE